MTRLTRGTSRHFATSRLLASSALAAVTTRKMIAYKHSSPFRFKHWLCTSAMIMLPGAAIAQTQPVETVVVNGERGEDAAATAPSLTPLDAVQPTSVISGDFIEKNFAPSTNYDEAIKFTPSTFDVAPNGPGLAESQATSIRGFQDGQFNVTFDGIHGRIPTTSPTTRRPISWPTTSMGSPSIAVPARRPPSATPPSAVHSTFSPKRPRRRWASILMSAMAASEQRCFTAPNSTPAPSRDTDGTRIMIELKTSTAAAISPTRPRTGRTSTSKPNSLWPTTRRSRSSSRYNHIHQGISLGATQNEIDTIRAQLGLVQRPAVAELFRLQSRPHHDRFRISRSRHRIRRRLDTGYEALHLWLLPSRPER